MIPPCDLCILRSFFFCWELYKPLPHLSKVWEWASRLYSGSIHALIGSCSFTPCTHGSTENSVSSLLNVLTDPFPSLPLPLPISFFSFFLKLFTWAFCCTSLADMVSSHCAQCKKAGLCLVWYTGNSLNSQADMFTGFTLFASHLSGSTVLSTHCSMLKTSMKSEFDLAF